MTRDDIIRMAREANFYDSEIGGNEDGFVRFAALVAARTLEASYDEMIALVRAAEREACARVCDEQAESPALAPLEKYRADFIAAAIRARGDKPCK